MKPRFAGKGKSSPRRQQEVRGSVEPGTFQHAEVHGVVGSLGHAEHHLQAVFDLPFAFLAAREELLQKTKTMN